MYRWTHDAKLVTKRRAAPAKLRTQLSSPQPAAKAIPRKLRKSDDWAVGSIRAYKLNTGDLCLLRVIGHHRDKGGTSPIAEVLDWVGASLRYADTSTPMIGGSANSCWGRRQSVKSRRYAFLTRVVSRPSQKPGGDSVVLGRHFDRDLARYFALGVSKT